MNEQLISFETAKLAKEKGFDISVNRAWSDKDNKIGEYEHFYFFNNDEKVKDHFRFPLYSAPTQSLLQKWLREKHHLIIIVAYQYEHDSTPYSYWIYKELQSLPINQWVNDLNTYEEALELGLQEALKLI